MDYDDGTAKYEFVGKLPNGKAFEVDVYTDGRVEEVEEEIDMNSSRRRFARRSTGSSRTCSLEGREEHARQPRRLVRVRRQGSAAEIDIEISADGKRILIQDDDAG